MALSGKQTYGTRQRAAAISQVSSKVAPACALALALLAPSGGVHASGIAPLYIFHGKDGFQPYGGVVVDAAGNLYGTTQYGGKKACLPYGCGTVFKLAPDGTETVLHLFGAGKDGTVPQGTLIEDSAGNLYGTTKYGGRKNGGTVFRIAPDGTETVLYAFTGKSDGGHPLAGLIEDSAGNFYGTTELGGVQDCGGAYCGTVFKIAPDGTETVLHAFSGTDGARPYGSLIVDSAGNFYGTTAYGGSTNSGTVFKLTPVGTETVLYSFSGGADGSNPGSGVLEDANGNLYGTTFNGGSTKFGVVYELAPDGTETALHTFAGQDKGDGAGPQGGLIADGAGNLYGTTVYGGLFSYGLVFRLAPDGTETTYNFCGAIKCSGWPVAGLVSDGAGNLYGTSVVGGKNGDSGTVFKLAE